MQELLARVSHRVRELSRDDGGFSLVELLVVVLIIGILAAVAIPSFAGQKAKAVDAQAKELARTAQTTAEAIATDNGGEYKNVTAAELNKYEPTIHIAASTSEAYVVVSPLSSQTEYTVIAKATNGDEFKITRSSTGEVTRKCVSPITKTGCGGVEKASW